MAAIQRPVQKVRGSDRAKVLEKNAWKNLIHVGDLPEGHTLAYVVNPSDTDLLGKLMGHCAGTHFVWTWEERIWYFFAILDKAGVPHATLHAKETKWIDKDHPRDTAEQLPHDILDRMPGGFRYGGYPPLSTFEEGFKAVGLEYKPVYRPPHYNSRTYDRGMNGGAGGAGARFDDKWYIPIPAKPDEIPEEMWNEFQRCWKSMRDAYNKAAGTFKINGRRFQFDDKDLTVLSLNDKSNYGCTSTYRAWIRDWLNDHQTKSGKVDVGTR